MAAPMELKNFPAKEDFVSLGLITDKINCTLYLRQWTIKHCFHVLFRSI